MLFYVFFFVFFAFFFAFFVLARSRYEQGRWMMHRERIDALVDFPFDGLDLSDHVQGMPGTSQVRRRQTSDGRRQGFFVLFFYRRCVAVVLERAKQLICL